MNITISMTLPDAGYQILLNLVAAALWAGLLWLIQRQVN